jgi:transcriptional regulator with XRE-family HTH domain
MGTSPKRRVLQLDPDKLRKAREAKNWSAYRAARQGQFSRAAWSRWESGQRVNPDIETLGRIAETLGCKVTDITTVVEVDDETAEVEG